MRISGRDAIIVLAKEIWYCIDSLTNRNFHDCGGEYGTTEYI